MNTNTTQICIWPGGRPCTIVVTALLALAISLGWGGQASALPINGGFETGSFSDWSTKGNTSIQTSSFLVDPVGGTYQALISNTEGTFGNTDDPATTAELETFLGLQSGDLSEYYATEGSAIRTSIFTATAGQVISFYYNFLTTDLDSSDYNDVAFVVLDKMRSRVQDTFIEFPIESLARISNDGGSVYETGYRRFSLVVPSNGTYRLGFGVVHANDDALASALLVDNISVPEPSSVVLFMLGLVGLVWWRRSHVASV